MPSKVFSAAVVGISGTIVEVEVDVLTQGLHQFTLVGLPDTSVKESRDRVSSALKNSGFTPPHHCGRITVNLAPADLQKSSPIYDVPIAVGFLMATKQLNVPDKKRLFIGELALDGNVRGVNGVLPIVLFAKENNIEELYVPFENYKEACIVDDVTIIPIRSLNELVDHLVKKQEISIVQEKFTKKTEDVKESVFDFAYIHGHEHAKRALEIAASGGHNVLFNGPPGSGKTLLAKTFATILPDLTKEEILDITKIYSIAGLLPAKQHIISERQFRAPHHSASAVSLIGGGTNPKPGEITLAHRGVLFLDEFAEFPRTVLENLRQPLEDGVVTIARAQLTVTFPAHFILVAAMNPCPCGFATDVERECTCTAAQVLRYSQKISGPILDRIDMHIDVPRIAIDKLDGDTTTYEKSESIRNRVAHARLIQEKRFNGSNIINAEMNQKEIKTHCILDTMSQTLLRQAAKKLDLSARSYFRIIKLARTIADLDASEHITQKHIAEALQYRML